MGAGASAARSPIVVAEIDRLRERELDAKEETVKEWDKEELKVLSSLAQLRSERNELAQRLTQSEVCLAQQREGWKRERERTMALTYSSLPLSLLSEGDKGVLERKSNFSISMNFPMVTIAQSDVVGFSQLVTKLKPQEVMRIIDYLHALVEEAYSSEEIFIMERNTDSCSAAAGLCDTLLEDNSLAVDSLSSLSLADSSYGSQNYLLDYDEGGKQAKSGQKPSSKKSSSPPQNLGHASHFAGQLASAALRLMSMSSRISVPLEGRRQLQLRMSLHSGPCLAGIQGLQVSAGSSRIPQLKLMGPTVKHASSLCQTGLALQIRVSRACKDLLVREGGFLFERCPDYASWASRKPIESYWLVGREDEAVALPSLDLAIPLSEYEDTDI